MDRKLVIIPTYNEIENIRNIVTAVIELKEFFDVLVVDDNSPDGTAGVVKQLIVEYPERVFLLERPGKQGLGTAYLAGFEWALIHDYDYIIE
ncbi:MAG: glycosyltransferase, partial [Porphyromonas sp.]|nr:glycosyltransferase [Porphyromonas sp.]